MKKEIITNEEGKTVVKITTPQPDKVDTLTKEQCQTRINLNKRRIALLQSQIDALVVDMTEYEPLLSQFHD